MANGAFTYVAQATHGMDLGQPGVIISNGQNVAFFVEVNIGFVTK